MEKDGYFGIVSKRKFGTDPSPSPEDKKASFVDHHSVGVVVRIIDQQQVLSNLVQHYAEFSVEAVKRIELKKVILNQDDQIVKICEVQFKDDEAEYKALAFKVERLDMITDTKEKALKLLELLGNSMDSKHRIGQTMRINDASTHSPVMMVYYIAAFLRYSNKYER